MIAAGELGRSRPCKTAVLLLAHGTPDSIDEIPEYLKNVVSGRVIPQSVIEEIQDRYARIGKSPLTEWTMRQAALLQEKISMPVYVGMRNWTPYIAETVAKMRADGVTAAVAVCMAPQNSRTSVGLYRRAAYAEAGNALQLQFIDAWATHPRLIDALAARLRPVWLQASRQNAEKIPVIFTAHSVPCRTIQSQPSEPRVSATGSEPIVNTGTVRPTLPERSYALPATAPRDPDPYAAEAKQTAALVAERLVPDGLTGEDWYFAFQSQGASGGPWVGPTVEDTMQALRQQGHRVVVLQPIGFLCDHVETLYDIDIAFYQFAHKLEMKLIRPASLNDSPQLIEALAELVSDGLAQLQHSTKKTA